jgi:hypothetical protein
MKEYKNSKESCAHPDMNIKTTMSFIFKQCPDCGYYKSETNRDPAIYNATIGRNSPYYDRGADRSPHAIY